MRFGVVLSERGPLARPEAISAITRRAEELGFHAVELGDHIVVPKAIGSRYPYTESGIPPEWDEWFEQLTTLSFLAGKTTSIRLVTSVMVLPYRHPLLALKMLATLDVLSNGRLILGVGAGWMREEFEALGIPGFAERGALVDDYLSMLAEVWGSGATSFRSKSFHFENLKLGPMPIQRPHPPIWVGGESAAAMRRAVRWGDAWYPIGGNPLHPMKSAVQLEASVSSLRRLALAAGRSSPIDVSLVAHQLKLGDDGSGPELFAGSAKKIRHDIRECSRIGVSYVSFDLLQDTLKGTFERMEAVSELLHGPG